ncbi:MAG: DUF4139 domain-containing protein [Flavobacteriales bacterium]|nr:DUF4139 domain-containing protein [Flavobacteriales bacterium]MCB9448991.1 DUF4139 domain-containing protein [Flavobacteriales bacterium]
MKTTSVFTKACCILIALASPIVVNATETDVSSAAERITVYHSGAMVNRTAQVDLRAGVTELSFRGISSKMILNTLKFQNRDLTVLNKTLIRKLTDEERQVLNDRRDALKNQLQLLETKFNEPGFVKEVSDLESMITYYSDKILEVKRNLRQVEKEISEAELLENIDLGDEHAAILKVTISAATPVRGEVAFQYVVGGIGWSPAYEINASSSSGTSIEVKYIAKVMSQTGENWEHVSLSFSSSFPLESPTTLPVAEEPWVLNRYGRPQPTAQDQSNAEDGTGGQIDRLEGVEYQDIRIPTLMKLRKLEGTYSLKSNSTVFSFPMLTVNLPATFYYYGFPGIDPETYLAAEVTGWDTIGFADGVADITYNGTNIGKSIIRFSEAQDTLLLPIGKDNSVYMKRQEVANQSTTRDGSTFKKQKSTMAFAYTVKNNNSFPIRYRLLDQFPISQNKSAEVELENISNGAIDYETGEVEWLLSLSPGQTEKKDLKFTIETDGDYRYSERGNHRAKYRTVSCPAF